MNRWFRTYSDLIDHPKFIRLSTELRSALLMIWCVACKYDGALPPVEDIALAFRMSLPKTRKLLEGLQKGGFIDLDETVMKPHKWNERQYKTDNSSDRVSKYREKRRAAGLPVLSDYSLFRPKLIARDGEFCIYCASTSKLVVDHLIPITLGGTDDIDNLGLACKPCNSGKAGRTPEMAGMKIIVTSAFAALARYRDKSARVTVTETPPDTDTDTETEKNGASAQPKLAVVATSSPDKLYFDQSVQLLGKHGRSLGAALLKAKEGNVLAAHSALLTAAQKSDPRGYIGAIINKRDSIEDLRARGDAW